MAKSNKTVRNEQSPKQFIGSVEHAQRRADALVLLDWFSRVTGLKPKMWGDSIIGYGGYHYRYDSGREGDALMTGFSPRKAAMSIYIMPGYRDMADKLQRLGRHKVGKSCLYVNKLSDIDMAVLEEIVNDGVAYMRKHYQTYD